MQYILQDLDKLKLDDPDEQNKLENEQNRLSNLLSLKEGVNSVSLRLNQMKHFFQMNIQIIRLITTLNYLKVDLVYIF